MLLKMLLKLNHKSLIPLSLMVSLLACEGGTTGAGANSGGPPIEGGYDNLYLTGDWIGTISPDAAKPEYLYYIRCGADGFAFAGADSRDSDWSDMDHTTYSWVRESGAFTISIIREDELTFFEGDLRAGGLIAEGRYQKVVGGDSRGTGHFSAVISGGPGTFSVGDQLPGLWSGEMELPDDSMLAVSLEINQFDHIVSGNINGVDLNLVDWTAGLPLFYDIDSVGRLQSSSFSMIDGSALNMELMLVDEAGEMLSAKALHSTYGQVYFSLSKN